MTKPTVGYGTFCCPKDQDRILAIATKNVESHRHKFDAKFFVFQRCNESLVCPDGFNPIRISDADYPEILSSFGIVNPDPDVEKWTHGWSASHYGFHHCVNHLAVLQKAETDYIVFADGDCYIKESPADPTWVDRGIRILESDPSVFVVSPNEGGPERHERIMSQQMFLINRKRFLEMEYIQWDGVFPDGGPMAEYHFMLEGRIARYMAKYNLSRYVLPPAYRYWHLEFH